MKNAQNGPHNNSKKRDLSVPSIQPPRRAGASDCSRASSRETLASATRSARSSRVFFHLKSRKRLIEVTRAQKRATLAIRLTIVWITSSMWLLITVAVRGRLLSINMGLRSEEYWSKLVARSVFPPLFRFVFFYLYYCWSGG
jgi:hypothetical protein